MRTIPLEAIIVPANRQRQEFEAGALQELSQSIEARGLLQAIVLRNGNTLVCGERRIRAVSDLYMLGGFFTHDGKVVPQGEIPFVDLGELDELAAEEAELDENLKRKDLTWQEQAAAIQKLHKLRQKQAEAKRETAADPYMVPNHTVADTALELHGRNDGDYQTKVRKQIIVAEHLDNPAIAGAKSTDEAFKILRRQEEVKKNSDLAVLVGKTFSVDDHLLLQVNCLDYMKGVHGLFDVILTDPPYGMGADGFGDAAGKLSGIEHDYDDSPEAWRKLLAEWAPLSYQVAKAQAHAYVFCDLDRFHELKGFMAAAGWYVFRTPFVVYKLNSGRVPLPDRGPRRQYELALYAIKGDKLVTHIYPDVIPCTADENMSHGAQKPVALYENLLARSVRPGDTIADFFCGTGPIFEAAHKFKCFAVGTEDKPDAYGSAMARLRRMKESETLPLPGV